MLQPQALRAGGDLRRGAHGLQTLVLRTGSPREGSPCCGRLLQPQALRAGRDLLPGAQGLQTLARSTGALRRAPVLRATSCSPKPCAPGGTSCPARKACRHSPEHGSPPEGSRASSDKLQPQALRAGRDLLPGAQGLQTLARSTGSPREGSPC
ncbi:Hypothetical predicted protein, partial [Podarcis lilfordi]